MTCFVLSWI